MDRHHPDPLAKTPVGMAEHAEFQFLPTGIFGQGRCRRGHPVWITRGALTQTLTPVGGKGAHPDRRPGRRTGKGPRGMSRHLPTRCGVTAAPLRGIHMAGQIGHPHARQEQKARIVHHPPQIGNPGPVAPADMTIPGRLMPAGRMKGQAAHAPQTGAVDPVAENGTGMVRCAPG